MSGGHFNHNGYIYYRVIEFVDELENHIQNNLEKDEYGYSYNFNEEAIEYLKKQLPEIKKIAGIMKAIDYLYSGDHAEDSFLRDVKSVEEEYKNHILKNKKIKNNK